MDRRFFKLLWFWSFQHIFFSLNHCDRNYNLSAITGIRNIAKIELPWPSIVNPKLAPARALTLQSEVPHWGHTDHLVAIEAADAVVGAGVGRFHVGGACGGLVAGDAILGETGGFVDLPGETSGSVLLDHEMRLLANSQDYPHLFQLRSLLLVIQIVHGTLCNHIRALYLILDHLVHSRWMCPFLCDGSRSVGIAWIDQFVWGAILNGHCNQVTDDNYGDEDKATDEQCFLPKFHWGSDLIKFLN